MRKLLIPMFFIFLIPMVLGTPPSPDPHWYCCNTYNNETLNFETINSSCCDTVIDSEGCYSCLADEDWRKANSPPWYFTSGIGLLFFLFYIVFPLAVIFFIIMTIIGFVKRHKKKKEQKSNS